MNNVIMKTIISNNIQLQNPFALWWKITCTCICIPVRPTPYPLQTSPVLLSPTITIVQTHENQKSYLRKILQLNDSCLNEFILNYYT